MYYYLDSEHKPCGPHSREQLLHMLQNNTLTPDTLVAADGGAAWVPLQHLQEQHNTTATCPYCNNAIPMGAEHNDTQPPLYCPHCNKQLHPAAPNSMLCNMGYGCKHLFRFKGRATRMEFWSMLLLSLFLIPALHIAGGFFFLWTVEHGYESLPLAIIGFLGMWVLQLLIFAALCTRRMRDAGFSPKIVWGLGLFPLCILLCAVAEQSTIRYSSLYHTINALGSFFFILGYGYALIMLILATKKSKQVK